MTCEVRIIHNDGAESGAVVGRTVNISARGLALQIVEPVPIGAEVEALVPHGYDRCLRLRGRVVHSRQVLAGAYEVGVAISAT